jgi:hypothetical protein
LDDGKNGTGKPNQFDGKNPWVSGVIFPVKTNPVNNYGLCLGEIMINSGWP